MKIQPQSGLGDLIFALPLIYDIAKREPVEVATNHPYVLARCTEWGNITTSPVEIDKHGFPIVKDGFVHLRYDRYGAHYFFLYYDGKGRMLLQDAVAAVRETFRTGLSRSMPHDYVVYAPPRAARRHAIKPDSSASLLFTCAPNALHAKQAIDKYDKTVVLVGNNDVYAPVFLPPKRCIDLRGKTSFAELCELIAFARAVISQPSAITTLAGLYARPTHFLKARTETDEEFKKHIYGVNWHNQEIL